MEKTRALERMVVLLMSGVEDSQRMEEASREKGEGI